ncbi:MAG: hypothetical protein ACLPVY_02165 [Acidimicrobiia bacterium]
MTEAKDRIEHTIEVLVLAPIGVGLYLKDMGPTFVNMFVARGRAEIDRRQAQVQQRTTTAKSIGQVAMTFGVPMVRQRVEHEVDSARQRAQVFLGSIGGSDAPARRTAPANTTGEAQDAPRARVKPRTTPAPQTARTETNGANTNGAHGASGAGDSLPIPGYDALSASQVVERLAGLSSDELDAVRSYEGAHRNRRTILGKIDQISA